jgi:hypothetical protein
MNNINLTIKERVGVVRDNKFLKFCYEQKFMMKKQIDSWFWLNGEFGNIESSKRVARRAVSRLLNLGMLNENTDRFFGKSKIYEVTKSGIQSLMDKGVLPEYCSKAKKNRATIYHDSLATNIRLLCQHLGVFENWISDRFLKFDDKEITPDACVTIKSKKLTLAIEIELTQKSKTRLRDIFYKYQHSHYDMVLYFVQGQGLLNSLNKLAAEYTPKIYFCEIDDFFNLQLNSVWVNQFDSFKTDKLRNGDKNG